MLQVRTFFAFLIQQRLYFKAKEGINIPSFYDSCHMVLEFLNLEKFSLAFHIDLDKIHTALQ